MSDSLSKLISECRKLLPNATAEQKLRLLKLLKESINKKSSDIVTDKKQNLDYLEEK